MKPFISVCSLAILLVIASCNDTATTETPAAKTDTPSTAATTTPTPPPQVDSATAQKNMMEYMTPGDIHTMLAKSNGTWNVETSMYMAPGAPPETSKGKDKDGYRSEFIRLVKAVDDGDDVKTSAR